MSDPNRPDEDQQRQPTNGDEDRLVHGYNRMIARVKQALEEAETHTLPRLRQGLDHAKERAVELGELTRDEAEWVADYVRRDLEEAGDYLARQRDDLQGWLRFDIQLIERQLWEMFAKVADKTRLEFQEFQQSLVEAAQYHTGEVAGPGTLQCVACEEQMVFTHTGRIPPCPRCRGTVFERAHRREAE